MAREILVAVVGLTPQVITETLYALTQIRNPPVCISEIWALTTGPGRDLIEATLLQPRTGKFHAFCRDFGLPPDRIHFDARSILVVPGLEGRPLEDIRTFAESTALADFIISFIRDLTRDPEIRLYGSIAGGRKTMGVDLALAFQLYGRPGDTLFHVLVWPPELEGEASFFYPPRDKKTIRVKGRTIRVRDIRVDLAEIPILFLREKLPVLKEEKAITYTDLIRRSQEELALLQAPPPLVVELAERKLRIGERVVLLSPLEMALYLLLARRRRSCPRLDCPGCPSCFLPLGAVRDEGFMAELEEQLQEIGGSGEGRLPGWQKAADREDRFYQVKSRINTKLQKALEGASWQGFYRIATQWGERRRGETRYGLPLDKRLIRIR